MLKQFPRVLLVAGCGVIVLVTLAIVVASLAGRVQAQTPCADSESAGRGI
jgi:hypothetical protein